MKYRTGFLYHIQKMNLLTISQECLLIIKNIGMAIILLLKSVRIFLKPINHYE